MSAEARTMTKTKSKKAQTTSKGLDTIKCKWCGQEFPLTAKGRPKQHKNGAKTCVGSGQPAIVHQNIEARRQQHLSEARQIKK